MMILCASIFCYSVTRLQKIRENVVNLEILSEIKNLWTEQYSRRSSDSVITELKVFAYIAICA